ILGTLRLAPQLRAHFVAECAVQRRQNPPHLVFGEAEAGGEGCIVRSVRVGREVVRFEDPELVCGSALPQPSDGVVDEGAQPRAVEGGSRIGGEVFEGGGVAVRRHEGRRSTPLDPAGGLAGVRQKPPEHAFQILPEGRAVALITGEHFAVQEPGKESLGQVLCVLIGGGAGEPHEAVDRLPVAPAQLFEHRPSRGAGGISKAVEEAGVRGGENRRWAAQGCFVASRHRLTPVDYTRSRRRRFSDGGEPCGNPRTLRRRHPIASMRRLLWVAVLVGGSAAGGVAQQSSPEGTELFEKRIRPVLAARCVSCHGAAAAKPKGGLVVDSLAGILRGGARGPAVVPGDAETSLLVRAIRRETDDLAMPPKESERLTEAEIQDFAAWIRAGAPGPKALPAAARASSHWSFSKPRPVAPPEVKLKDWPVTGIDRFILAELEKKGVTPAAPADPATLLRRVTFDLTGLPPSPAEVDAFLRDTAPGAYDRVVDRLLASPRYGERWARHWLDVARYADTKGGSPNSRFPYAYTYRDWVVRAFNEDLPYDRFILLQLAADRVEGAKPEDRAALGFLTVGRRFAVAADGVDDQIDVVTRGFLGLTVTCARCHDHKFDPIPTADYYSLYGVFAASQEPKELPLLGGPGPLQAAYEAERERRQAEADRYLASLQAEEVKQLRKPERIAEYLLAAVELKGLSVPEARV